MVEANTAHAAALHNLAGSTRTFLGEAAFPAIRALNRAGAPRLLPVMQGVVNAVRLGIVGPEAALYGKSTFKALCGLEMKSELVVVSNGASGYSG